MFGFAYLNNVVTLEYRSGKLHWLRCLCRSMSAGRAGPEKREDYGNKSGRLHGMRSVPKKLYPRSYFSSIRCRLRDSGDQLGFGPKEFLLLLRN